MASESAKKKSRYPLAYSRHPFEQLAEILCNNTLRAALAVDLRGGE
jgi:hypothetical protein